MLKEMIEDKSFTAEQVFCEDEKDCFGEKYKIESTFSKKTNSDRI